MKKILIFALIMLMITLPGCVGNTTPDGSTTTPPSDDTSSSDVDTSNDAVAKDGITLHRGETTDYVVIVGKNASSTELAAADRLIRALKNCLSVTVSRRIDLTGTAGYEERPTEIVVGATSRDMSDLWDAAAHRSADYFIGVRDRRLFIVGATDTATDAAVSAFIRAHLELGMETLSFGTADNLEYQGDYAISSLSLNGRELREFSFGATAYTTFAKLSLRTLADAVTQNYGYTASVKAKSADLLLTTTAELPELSALLGDRVAVLGAVGGQAYLVGRSAGELYTATAALCRDLSTLSSLELRDGEIAWEYLPDDSGRVRVMSFNLMGATDMSARTEAVTWVIASHYPDVLGIQEGNDDWLRHFETNLSSIYDCVGEGTHESGYSETYDNIYYRRDRFLLNDSGTIWLSETPDVAGSKLESSKRVRIATWALLTDRLSGSEVLFVNTHLDNASATARSGQADILLQFLSGYDCQKVVTGDFNSNMSSSIYSKMTSVLLDARVAAAEQELDVTYNALGERSGSILDYVYVSRGLRVERYAVASELYGGTRYPSDHNAVVVDFYVG